MDYMEKLQQMINSENLKLDLNIEQKKLTGLGNMIDLNLNSRGAHGYININDGRNQIAVEIAWNDDGFVLVNADHTYISIMDSYLLETDTDMKKALNFLGFRNWRVSLG